MQNHFNVFLVFLEHHSGIFSLVRCGFIVLAAIFWPFFIEKISKNWSIEAIQAAKQLRWPIFVFLGFFEIFIVQNLLTKFVGLFGLLI